MTAQPDISLLASLMGDPARSGMLDALMDGRALTAKELAYYGGITPQTASSHLAKLAGAGLIQLEQQGRHHYYRLASPRVAEAMEAMMVLAAHRRPARRPVPQALQDMRVARTCYDHLAGFLGVSLTGAMLQRGLLAAHGREFQLTPKGLAHLERLGVDVAWARRQRRALARQCLDWTERRVHLAGALGSALATRCLKLKWIARQDEGRALRITPAGREGFRAHFGVNLERLLQEDSAPPAS
ncbi:MAG TPA: helix-turn-helix transcriptional regulator [bacterium]|nr:helix-turn-helix transcriptional regulator [bacterium]